MAEFPSKEFHRYELAEAAAAKINLDLLVCGKRPDGYHELDSIVVFTDIGDELQVAAAEELTLTVTGPFAQDLDISPANNLVMRAARLLQAFTHHQGGAAIRLVKNLPVASGIGGGSADAAACLRALNRLWNLDRHETVLRELALEIGSDVPVCVFRKQARMRGLGERIDPIRLLPDLWLVLANPLTAVPTAKVFKRLSMEEISRRPQGFPSHPSRTQLAVWLGYTRNDLEAPAIELCPEIATILEQISQEDGCLLARMSGSGATCFGLFSDETRARTAATHLKSVWPDYWVTFARA